MPTLHIIAGPNGSGKNDIAKSINSQDVAKAYMQAGREFFRKLNEILLAKKSVVMETTLSGKYHNRVIENFKKSGYEIELRFVFLDNPQICIERIKNRVLKGGHNVPSDDVIRRFFRSKQNFTFVKNLVSYWELYYNGGNEFILVANGRDSFVEIINDSLYKKFIGEQDGS